MDIETRLAELAELGIGCPRAVQIRGPVAVQDWADDQLVTDESDNDSEPATEGPVTAQERDLLRLLEGVDPIEALESIANQAAELLARMRSETEAGADPTELLAGIVAELPAPEGFLVWAKQIMDGIVPPLEEPAAEEPAPDIGPAPDSYAMEIDRLKEYTENLDERIRAQESQGRDQWAAIEANTAGRIAKYGGKKKPAPQQKATPQPSVRKTQRQCAGSTKKGSRCQRWPMADSHFCSGHAEAGEYHEPRV